MLAFDLNKLTGTIPDSIIHLTNLTHIQLWNNSITGTFPFQFCHLLRLTVIFLPYNHINGSLPDCLGNLTALRVLIMESNIMSGTIPSSLGLLTHIFDLDLLGNRFTGTLPDTLCDINDLLYLYLFNNLLTGTVPVSLGRCQRLRSLTINNNMFSGTFPAKLATVSSLQYLDVSYNMLSGSIPSDITSMTSMIQMIFSDNLFTGSIPSNIGDFRKINTLFLDSNCFTGSIPTSIGDLSTLFNLGLEDNKFRGTLPTTISSMKSIVSLNVLNNMLSGSLKGVFNASSQPSLSTIQLSHNQFTGKIPDELFELLNLSSLSMESNCFIASLPIEMCQLKQLKVLDLSGLHTASTCQQVLLPGLSASYVSVGSVSQKSIPDCYFHMQDLLLLHLSGNSLTGTIPTSISATLQDLSLSHNFFSGTIPSSVQDRSWLNLDLSHNRLTGELNHFDNKDEENNMSLRLNVNRLSGAVPSRLIDMHNISILNGNLFSCSSPKDLPKHDPNLSTFECGSNAFNTPYLIFGIILGCLAFLAVLLFRYHRRIPGLVSMLPQLTMRWLHLRYELAQGHMKSRLATYMRWLVLVDVLLEITWYSSIYIIFVLSPVYIILNRFYRTTEQSYAWVVSLAYFSGVVAGSVALIVLVFFLCLIVVMIRWGLLKYSTSTSNDTNNDVSKSVTSEYDLPIEANAALKASSVTSFELGDTITGNDTESTRRTSEFMNPAKDEGYKRMTLLERTRIYGLYMAINFAVTLGANIAYIYAVFNGSSVIIAVARILLSIFKLFWNGVCGPVLTSWSMHAMRHFERDGSELFSVQLFVGLVNNIAIPCLTVAIISPNCFYNFFVPSDAVKSQYLYKIRYVDTIGSYSKYFDFYEVGSTSYAPPFVYSYQCSSSMITSYAPAFTYVCIFAAFVNPIGQVMLQQLHSHMSSSHLLFRAVKFITPRILITTDEASMKEVVYDVFYPYSNARQVTVNALTFIGILFTFGVAFPPLGFAVAVTMVIGLIFAQLKIGRFLSLAIEKDCMNCVDTVDEECCKALSMKFLKRSKWMLALFSSCFYSIFVFDEFGDQVGYVAFWILIFMPLAPLLMYQSTQIATHVLMRWSTHRRPSDDPLRRDSARAISSDLSKAVAPSQDNDKQKIVFNPMKLSPDDDIVHHGTIGV